MIKYEFKIAAVDIREAEKFLNDLGSSGWQLTSVVEASSTIVRLFMQRPVQLGTLGNLEN